MMIEKYAMLFLMILRSALFIYFAYIMIINRNKLPFLLEKACLKYFASPRSNNRFLQAFFRAIFPAIALFYGLYTLIQELIRVFLKGGTLNQLPKSTESIFSIIILSAILLLILLFFVKKHSFYEYFNSSIRKTFDFSDEDSIKGLFSVFNYGCLWIMFACLLIIFCFVFG